MNDINPSPTGQSKLEIPFTQYLRPDGHKRQASFSVFGATVCAKATELLVYGWKFECEVLTTGKVSLTVNDGDEDRAIQVVTNGPTVPKAVNDLVMDAYKEMAEEAIAEAR